MRNVVRGQMKIQQMAFMIVAVFLFFVLVGLFFLAIEFRGIKNSAAELQKEQTISSLKVIADMPELNCDSSETLCVDEDKLLAMSAFPKYSDFLPVSSIKVYKIHPSFAEQIKCPAVNCNYFEIFNNNPEKEYSTFISLCKKIKEFGYVYEKCEIAKLSLGVKS